MGFFLSTFAMRTFYDQSQICTQSYAQLSKLNEIPFVQEEF